MKYNRFAFVLASAFLLAGCGVTSRTVQTHSPVSSDKMSIQEQYIARYADVAVSERKRSGVPASITLAQGMLESANGQSELAVKGNNHFGIKCHDWTGARMYYDDDRKGECFRKYRSPEASFRDHSDFLRYRDRYKFLFDFNTTDYESWAYGLKKAGYATDPAYPQKLIRLIEDYDLDRFDKASYVKKDASGKRKAGMPSGNADKTVRPDMDNAVAADVPATPAEVETPKPLSDRQGKALHLSLTRQLYSQNGVPFVYSVQGETYTDIAKAYDLFLGEILRFNDLDTETELQPGTVVYLQAKKSKAAKLVDKYVAEGGESLRDIAQRFAVKLKSLEKLNGIGTEAALSEGEMIMLRK